jgi:hypothetical protein
MKKVLQLKNLSFVLEPPLKRKVATGFRLDPEFFKKLKIIAVEHELTVSSVIELILCVGVDSLWEPR